MDNHNQSLITQNNVIIGIIVPIAFMGNDNNKTFFCVYQCKNDVIGINSTLNL